MSAAVTGRRGRRAAGVQRALDGAGFWRREQFGPRQIGLEEIVGNHEAAALVAVEQVMAAREPEVAHLRSGFVSEMRSTRSGAALASSPSTLKKEKARAGLAPWRGRRVRNRSRSAPSS